MFCPEPQDALHLLYRLLLSEASDRHLMMSEATDWARRLDPSASAADIEPSRWSVTLKIHGERKTVNVEPAWDMEQDAFSAIITE